MVISLQRNGTSRIYVQCPAWQAKFSIQVWGSSQEVHDPGALFGGEFTDLIHSHLRGAEAQAELLVMHPDVQGLVALGMGLPVLQFCQQGMDAGPRPPDMKNTCSCHIAEGNSPAFQVQGQFFVLF